MKKILIILTLVLFSPMFYSCICERKSITSEILVTYSDGTTETITHDGGIFYLEDGCIIEGYHYNTVVCGVRKFKVVEKPL